MRDITGELDGSKSHYAADNTVSERVRTASDLQKTVSQQYVNNYVNKCGKLVAERSLQYVTFRKYCADLENKLSRSYTTMETEKNCDDEGIKDRK